MQTVVIGTGVIGAFYSMRGDISLLKRDIGYLQRSQESLTQAFTQLGSILTQVAVQDSRLQSIERGLDELSHGKGFVN